MLLERLLLIAYGIFGINAIDNIYCDRMLCPIGNHVACGAISKEYGQNCSIDAELSPINNKLREIILNRFNELRNQLAGGGFAGFAPADRMASLSWDKELSYLAEFNVLKCKLHRDSCQNTKKFGHVGQTVSYRGHRRHIPELDDVITTQINIWFKERESSSMTDIYHYKGSKHSKPIGNFIQMAMGENHRVGCAILQQTKNDWLQIFLTCNYAKAPVVGKLVYKSGGKGGISCKTGKHPTFSNLCSVNEDYDDETSSNEHPPSKGSQKSKEETYSNAITNEIENQSGDSTNPGEEASSGESTKGTTGNYGETTTEEALQARGKPLERASDRDATTNSPQITTNTTPDMEDINGLPLQIPYWGKATPDEIDRKEKNYNRFFKRFVQMILHHNAKWKHRQIEIITSNFKVDDISKYKKGKRFSKSQRRKKAQRTFQIKRRRYQNRDESVDWVTI